MFECFYLSLVMLQQSVVGRLLLALTSAADLTQRQTNSSSQLGIVLTLLALLRAWGQANKEIEGKDRNARSTNELEKEQTI